MSQAGHAVRIVAARGEQWTDRIPFLHLPLVDSRHPRVLAVKAALDRGDLPADFDPLTSEIMDALCDALSGVHVLVAHNVCSLNKNLALTAAIQRISQLTRAPRVILWHHDLAWTTPRYRAELHDGYPWDLLRTDWGARHVVVSDLRRRELADLLNIPIESVAVVPNGVDRAAFFKFSPTTTDLLNQMDCAQAEPILLLPVRITPRKNIELALRVLAALRNKMRNAALIVTGPLGAHNAANAEYFERLKNLRGELGLSGTAYFLAELSERFLPDEVIADFYRLADALILPSREEGFGIPLVEAAFSRLPVFCSEISPLQDLGQNDVTYFSFEADPQQIADLIAAHLMTDPVYQFAARARRSFTWERVYADHIASLLKE